MSQSDSAFFKPFAFVLGALVLFTLFVAFVANLASPKAPEDPLVLAERQTQLKPVGRLRVVGGLTEEAAAEEAAAEEAAAEEAASKEAMSEEAAPEEAESEEAISEETTQAETSESAATAEGSTDGEANTEAAVDESASGDASTAETESATAGDAAAAVMTSEQMADVPVNVRAAVATNCAGCHNDGLHGAAKPDDAQAWSALAGQGIDVLTMSVINGKGKMPARAESRLSDDEIRQAVQLMIAKATGGDANDASGAAVTNEAAATATAAAATQADTQASTQAETAIVQNDQAVGQAVPDEVKQVVDSTCAACHTAGVANAPKFGDKDAWAKRMEVGIDAVVASAIAGKGAMPPRGGSQLDDEQMKLAIEYMMSK